ncbi:hypothetical protein DW070_15385 [Coprococcus catus]|uniref:CRISPR system Cms protein Csm4 n=1 Tax=Coprococcus catus TaxID=116085 RepID=A0A3E2TF31_9FIRM|nr:hypothetical protein DW070_15385 [Coprococcus catus]
MKYSIYQLDFYNGVRFGKGRLETTEMTFHADTLFAALFQEAIKLGKEKIFLDAVRNGALRWSDAFPYKAGSYFFRNQCFSRR